MPGKRLIAITMSAGVFLQSAGTTPADSLDTAVYELQTVTVSAPVSRRMLKMERDGAIDLLADHLGEQVTFLGGGDPLAVVRSLPSVATANDLQATVNVRGAATGDNLFCADNARVVNPLHMLGLFSAFNPAYYQGYTFRAGRVPSVIGSLTSAYFSADSGMEPDSLFSGTVSVGIIESHAAVRLPLGRRMSVSAGVRQTYLDALFPHLLTFDNTGLGYDFTDVNLAAIWAPTDADVLRISYFGNRDRLGITSDSNGSKDGRLGWSNNAVSATWRHRSVEACVAYSSFSNMFNLDEGGRTLDLPSSLHELKAAVTMPFGALTAAADVCRRSVSGQNGYGAAGAWEYSLAADYRLPLGQRAFVGLGLRITAYTQAGRTLWRPQPRAELSVDLGSGYGMYVAASRRVRFDRMVEETTAGLPADFWALAGAGVPAADVYDAEAGVSGYIGASGIYFSTALYGRLMRHVVEWDGSLIDLSSADYNPLDNVLDGRGYAAGITVSLMRQTGKVRGRIGYSYGVSRSKFGRFGCEWLPSAHDRPHDFNVALNYNPVRPLMLSASYTYASGTPYTQAKYGYMIGENLICEYFPHNSSCLPAYSRLDLAVSWTISRNERLSHTINISVYNALATHNVLFRFASYTGTEGIRMRDSEMKTVIPSVSYTLKF